MRDLLEKLLIVFVIGIFVGGLFRIMQWPDGFIISFISLILAGLTWFYLILSKKKKNIVDLLKLILGIGVVVYLALRLMDYQMSSEMRLLFILFASSLGLLTFLSNSTNIGNEKLRETLKKDGFYLSGFLVLGAGLVLMIMNVPYADYLLYFGLGLAAIWMIFTTFKKSN